MAKYILHGGLPQNGMYKQDFYDEIVLSLPQQELTLLYVKAGVAPEKKQQKTEAKQQEVNPFLPKKQVKVLMADEDPEKFLDQTHTADIIYFGGGDTQELLKLLRQMPLDILTQHLQDKVIVGVSAGANALSKYYFSNYRQQIEEGLGILPIKAFCHYTENKEPQLEELEAHGEHLTSFALPEDYFVIIQ